jgi:L-rhamnose mutarotase
MPTLHAIKMVVIFLSVSCFLFAGCSQPQVTRVGQVIGIKKANIEEYKKLHADAWPGVLKMIDKANIHNYSIYLGATEKETDDYYLFSYFEYTGKDFDADMAIIAADETTQKWWKHTDPLQTPLPTHKEGEWWSPWKEVFHHAGPPHDCKNPKRVAGIIGLRPEPENIIAYTQLHAAVWPGVLDAIDRANIRNFSIYHGQLEPGKHFLFSYFEYVGDDFEGDMKRIGQDKVTQVWWTYTDPLQIQLPTRGEGANWADIEEVFFTD